MGEHIEVRIERLFHRLFTGQAHAHGCDLAGAEVVVAARAAQLVLRDLVGLQAEHRQVVEVGALAEHLAGLSPGGVEQDEQRAPG